MITKVVPVLGPDPCGRSYFMAEGVNHLLGLQGVDLESCRGDNIKLLQHLG